MAADRLTVDAVPLPSPSAFPALSPTSHASEPLQHSAAPTTDHAATTQSALSYARASSSNLPPTKAPEGVSLPPAPHSNLPATANGNGGGGGDSSPTGSAKGSKERPQWVRPDGHASEKPKGPVKPGNHRLAAGGGPGPRHSGAAAGGGHSRQPRQSNGHASAQNGHAEAEPSGAKRPRTVPGMPASMLPPVANKKAKHKSGNATAPPPAATANDGGQQASEIPAIGKKRRSNLRKTLPPTASKLSALAASFDFVPRGDAPSLPAPITTMSQSSPPTAAPAPKEDKSEDGKAAPADSSAAEDSTEASPKGGAETSLLSESESAAIRDTVGSAGAQGDEFRSQTFSAADARGAVEAQGTEPGLQSASAKKPVAAGSAPEPERHGTEATKATLSVVETHESSLGGFLDQAFVEANGDFAPLDLPQTDENAGEPAAAAVFNQVPITRIEGAVDESPIADLSWREKKGWWSDDYDGISASTTPVLPPSPEANDDEVDPTKAGPAAVEPAQSQAEGAEQILMRLPPWKPELAKGGEASAEEQKPAKEVLAEGEVKPLVEFLPKAFVAQPDDDAEKADESEEAPVVSTSRSGSSSALSSFLSKSFSATGPPTPLEAPATFGEGEDAAPLNAEAVVAEKPLADILDVDAIENGKVVNESAAESKPKKHGWWSSGYVPPEEQQRPSGEGLVDEKLVQETVGSAGAQGDEFHARSYSEADKAGIEEVEPTPASAQSAASTPAEKKEAAPASCDALKATPRSSESSAASSSTGPSKEAPKEQKGDSAAEPAENRPSTPIGQFLNQAFSAKSDQLVSEDSETKPEHQDGTGLVDDRLVQETVGSAGAQGDEFRAQSFTSADQQGVEESTPVPASAQSSASTVSEKKAADAGETSISSSANNKQGSTSANSTPRASPSAETLPTITANTPVALRRRSSSSSSTPPPTPRRSASGDADKPHHSADDAPSLTLAIASAWHTAPWTRKLWAVLASVAINIGLPFVNGVMLGQSS